ncbi:hypothetical protein AALC17_20280, partial [Oscillospiraceae bacterium 38-13]
TSWRNLAPALVYFVAKFGPFYLTAYNSKEATQFAQRRISLLRVEASPHPPKKINVPQSQPWKISSSGAAQTLQRPDQGN